jgi:hypothetical protein
LVKDGGLHRGVQKRTRALCALLVAVVVLAVAIPVALANSTTGWTASAYLSSNGTNVTADTPYIAVSGPASGGAGNIGAIWLNTSTAGGTSVTHLDGSFDDPSSSGFSATSEPGFADPIASQTADSPQVAEDSSGNAVAVWIENGADDGDANPDTDAAVMTAYEPAGSDQFHTPTVIEASGVVSAEPHVATDSSGDTFAVWAEQSAGVWSVDYAIAPSGSGGAFGTAKSLVTGLSSDPQPDLAIGRSGAPATGGDDVTVVYVDQGTGLFISQGIPGATLAAPTNAWSTADTLAQPVVALDGNADAAVAWVDNGRVVEDLMTGLSSSFVLAPDFIQNGTNESDPQVAMLPQNNVDAETAVGFYNSATNDVVAALQSGSDAATGNGWEAAGIPVTNEPSTIVQQPQLAIPSNGAVTMLWQTSTAVEAMTSTVPPNSTTRPVFSNAPVQLSDAGATFPTCDADSCATLANDAAGDNLAAAWLQKDSSSNVQVAASCFYQATGSTGFNADTCARSKTPQTISFTQPAGGTVGGTETLSASATSGNPVVFSVDASSSPSDACSVSGTNGTTLSFAHAGSCVIDANQAGDSTYAAAAQVSHTVAVAAALGTTTTSTTTTPTTTTPTSTETATTATSTAPAPVLGKSSDASASSGTVEVKLPGSNKFVTLSSTEQLPLGTIVDATHGTVTITTALPGGGTSTATFWAGAFTLVQSPSGALTATLVGDSYAGCPKPGKHASRTTRLQTAHLLDHSSKGKKKPGTVVGSLWTSAKGNYTTKGKNGSAAVLGTVWLTRNQCNGTYFQVAKTTNDPHGEIRVTVLHPHRHTVLLKRGHSLLAPAPGF